MNSSPISKIRLPGRCGQIGRTFRATVLGVNLVWVAGCRAAPSINLLGSFFPGWMFCMFLGVAGVLVMRLVFVRTNIHQQLPLRAFVYFCLWVLITLATWLLFFRS